MCCENLIVTFVYASPLSGGDMKRWGILHCFF
nr:MAG TPA: hypothetical protein [Caudoviricetes sp.]